ncbi:MAG: methyltransferase domain-containing protein [Nitriliruptorales bacterium]|nr:methyltransferase domain-containing protein [Nitriliruptorales bacterium]
MAWDPEQYLRFADRRTRPALELLARVEAEEPGSVVDLGCGPGHLTVRLRERWPDARIVAVDSSVEMLARAREEHDDLEVEWVEADAAVWEPDEPPDVIYSNAVLHWLDDHEELFPRLVSLLSPGGVLAVGMPRNHPEPSHTTAVEVARAGEWREVLEPVLRPRPVAEPHHYYDLLVPHTASLDIWETVYLHVFPTADHIADWTGGSMLRPLVAELEPDQAERFEEQYREGLRSAYPPGPDGRVVFPFRRQFIVARSSQ